MTTLELYEMAADHREAWQAALASLGLLPDTSASRAAALESFLDRVEVILEIWGREHGA
jgi:hypothetical protein